MKLFIAGMDTETNTFSPLPTGHLSFAESMIAHGDATRRRPVTCCSAQLVTWRERAEAEGWAVVESLCVTAEPGGVTVRPVYEAFRDEILADLRAALPVDAVLLALHGAMVADGYDDVEGDLLSRVRDIVGPGVPVGAELDLHCHITDRMVAGATALVAYKEYPHTDITDRAAELFRLIADAAAGRTRPVMAMHDCRMIGTFRPPEAPLRGLVDRMIAMEGRDGILSVSFGHGFPWGDVADVGARMLVVADGDVGLARRTAEALGAELFALRHQLAPRFMTVDEALDEALAESAGPGAGPVVVADVSDNAGGGAPGDSTFVLARVLERGITGVASAMHWDPVAVRFCQEAGEGATLDLRIGGKSGTASGDPVDLRVTVRRLMSGITQRFGTVPVPIGDAAWVSGEGIDLVLNTVRTQTFHPECMTSLGLDPAARRIVLVKSNYHFQAGFAPIARRILFAAAPGALEPRFDAIPYTKLTRPYWPKVEDPFADA